MDRFAKNLDLSQIRVSLTTISPSTSMVALNGEMDRYVYDGVTQFITDNIPPQSTAMIVGMLELTFMDSSGVKMLYGLHKKFGQNGLAVYKANQHIYRVLEVSNLSRNVTFIKEPADIERWRWADREAA